MFDAIVVGLGGVGSFALRALSKEKSGSFLGVEKFIHGHSKGSSHGLTRIYRRAYFENIKYVPWIEYSLGQFHQMQVKHHSPLLQECGTLLMSPKGQGEKDLLPPLLKSAMASALEHSISVHLMETEELRNSYPQFNYSGIHESLMGLLEPGGGILRPELILSAAIEEARNSDASVSIRDNTFVEGFELVEGNTSQSDYIVVRLKTADDQVDDVQTRCLLISAGAWTAQSHLVPEWSRYLRVTRQLQGWFNCELEHDQFSLEQMSPWVLDTPCWPKPLYGVPVDTHYNTRHLKFGVHGRDEAVPNPSFAHPTLTQKEEQELYTAADCVLKFNKQARLAASCPCLYTMTPDLDYIIGSPRESSTLFAVAGLSGHGFKMVPALGQMMADFALGKGIDKWNASFCSPKRFL